ncbi:hypothetical protein ONA00_06675 [Mycoplasmopsis cynos]|uniref:hypothetical protein n=1 Tax=Mycoplasmopsis cynos TaxID=171284 RepID=UPI0024C8C72C|nr:hypothetical protein [Mycoplasmopsis cynos]WAM10930.1 hypothetical protein ONA00_06675 [Mycoplasmopsis cynos]
MLKISDLACWIKNFIIILMFRYEQPQKGRYRQFYQASIEIVGEKNYLKDVEAIYLGITILLELELPYILKINSIGDEASRAKYQEDLKQYLLPFKDQLSDISKERLDSGKVLRILDDKVDSKLDFMKNALKFLIIYLKNQKHILIMYKTL